MSNSSPARLTVCLLLEGTYPFVRGGVSSWTHQLIRALPDIDFFLYTLSPEPDQTAAYELPDNVIGMQDLLLRTDTNATGTAPPGTVSAVLSLLSMLSRNDVEVPAELLRELSGVANMSTRLVRSREFWNDLVRQYLERNPYYPFSEFFWTWFNSRAVLLTLLESTIPKADIYHSLCTGYAGFAATMAKAVHRKPYMLTEHGIYHRERSIEVEASDALRGRHRDEWRNFFFGLSRLSYHSADRIITLFEANHRMELAMGAPPQKSVIIPNGIDVQRFSAVRRQPRPGFHVGLVGRVVPIKDIKTFISVARIITDHIPESRFYCVGPTEEDPLYFSECRQLVESLGLSENFVFTGNQDVREYYAFLDVVMLTSLSEAQPLVILEAFAVGVPVVSTRVGDVPALLAHDYRYIAPPKDAQGLAERTIAIHEDPEGTAAWVEERKATVYREYNRDAVFQQYRDEYWRIHSQWQE